MTRVVSDGFAETASEITSSYPLLLVESLLLAVDFILGTDVWAGVPNHRLYINQT